MGGVSEVWLARVRGSLEAAAREGGTWEGVGGPSRRGARARGVLVGKQAASC